MIRQTCDGERQRDRLFLLPGAKPPLEAQDDWQGAWGDGSGLKQVKTQDISRTDGGLGHTVADSAVALAGLLTDPRSDWYTHLDGKRILELGCGAGLAGFAVAAAFPAALVHVTDCNPAIVDHVARLAAEQGLANVRASALDWNEALRPGFRWPRVDVVIAADCIYHQIPSAFTATALHFLKAPASPEQPPAQLFMVSPHGDSRPGTALVLDRLRQEPGTTLECSTATLLTYHGRAGQREPKLLRDRRLLLARVLRSAETLKGMHPTSLAGV